VNVFCANEADLLKASKNDGSFPASGLPLSDLEIFEKQSSVFALFSYFLAKSDRFNNLWMYMRARFCVGIEIIYFSLFFSYTIQYAPKNKFLSISLH